MIDKDYPIISLIHYHDMHYNILIKDDKTKKISNKIDPCTVNKGDLNIKEPWIKVKSIRKPNLQSQKNDCVDKDDDKLLLSDVEKDDDKLLISDDEDHNNDDEVLLQAFIQHPVDHDWLFLAR